MSGETDLNSLLEKMQPKLLSGEYVYCTLSSGTLADVLDLNPLATFQEAEGLSVLLEKSQAEMQGMDYSSSFCGITLSVHSALNAVGFTAAVAEKLSASGIPCNIIAANFHDHIFVPVDMAEKAISLLAEDGMQ
ncbi:MAG: ACT domain-containing protein [Gammaproteobacteria bacterium]|nr:ACT domain-containing protein [Gammaproteobacteria bacterium]